MKMKLCGVGVACRMRRWWAVPTLLLGVMAGCSSVPAGAPTTLSRTQFKALYADTDAITDVYYMGSDSQYHHFIMEHWTIKPDGSDGTLDSSKHYQVSVEELIVEKPFAYTTDKDHWRLLRPG
jgi:hypothetical protein